MARFQDAENLEQIYKLSHMNYPRGLRYDSPMQIYNSKDGVINAKVTGRDFRHMNGRLCEDTRQGLQINMPDGYDVFANERKCMFNKFRLWERTYNKEKILEVLYGTIISNDCINIIMLYYDGKGLTLNKKKRIK